MSAITPLNTPMYFDTFDTPAGTMIAVQSERGLHYVEFQDGPHPLPIGSTWLRDADFCRTAREQLLAYFAGELTIFNLPMAPLGTDFQQRVWAVLAKVPYGQTITYGAMAKQLQQPSAARAVGMANGRNPLSIVLPCHRVVGSNHTLTGYRGGLPIKTLLLKLEGVTVNEQQPLGL
jgi:methylated-DNA-[protein]-cysteine S-methyltransferase